METLLEEAEERRQEASSLQDGDKGSLSGEKEEASPRLSKRQPSGLVDLLGPMSNAFLRAQRQRRG